MAVSKEDIIYLRSLNGISKIGFIFVAICVIDMAITLFLLNFLLKEGTLLAKLYNYGGWCSIVGYKFLTTIGPLALIERNPKIAIPTVAIITAQIVGNYILILFTFFAGRVF